MLLYYTHLKQVFVPAWHGVARWKNLICWVKFPTDFFFARAYVFKLNIREGGGGGLHTRGGGGGVNFIREGWTSYEGGGVDFIRGGWASYEWGWTSCDWGWTCTRGVDFIRRRGGGWTCTRREVLTYFVGDSVPSKSWPYFKPPKTILCTLFQTKSITVHERIQWNGSDIKSRQSCKRQFVRSILIRSVPDRVHHRMRTHLATDRIKFDTAPTFLFTSLRSPSIGAFISYTMPESQPFPE